MTQKGFVLPVQQIKDSDRNPHPWYMGGSACIDPSGLISTTTHLESHIALSGFTGGMIASFWNSSGQALYVTPLLQYGVDGYSVPSWFGMQPSPRNVSANFQVDPSIYDKVDKISIYVFHAGKNRVGAILNKLGITAEDIVKWILSLESDDNSGNDDGGTIASQTSQSLISNAVTPLNPGKYAIYVPNGRYLTAVNGGGIGESSNKLPLHTDATAVGPWEKFKFVAVSPSTYAIQTINGHYITAVNGGGMGEAANKLPLHTDATQLGPWEIFTIDKTSDGYMTIRTSNGRYITAVNGGGIGEPANKLPLHTDATKISVWEKFSLVKR